MLGSEGEGMVEVGAQPRGRKEEADAKETLCRPEKTDAGCVVGSKPDVRGQGFWQLAQPWGLEKESQELGRPPSFSRKCKKKKKEFPEVT